MFRNPFPKGWIPGRLDQGWDGTFREKIIACFFGRVVFSEESDPGWRGGGYIAVRRSKDGHVFYWAEGCSPTLRVGQRVWPGRRIALPKANPYNGTPGNIEWGRANPAQPGQPLAQVISNKREMVMSFYEGWRKKGLGKTTDDSRAGYP